MKGHSNTNINHINLNNLLSSNSSNDILKMFSQQFMPMEKSNSENTQMGKFESDNMSSKELALSKSMSTKSSKKESNFKVVVRVRPQLSQENGLSS